ncbi:hypothetical protein Acsp03_47930 [Actinomadura sp. NBRC 104412]|uniref:hypothetical protein n=1 Tax=Actinomadura sp. NBRC 104412 TaxID=3032203 RepID=UPI0024A376A4|nr:hypothetical protein [Actinomadura sp. NBRC 104412]GLZ07327.1 hypothetical protein Acsp03_47930 [Actinomadura sp. NBRC 104412]
MEHPPEPDSRKHDVLDDAGEPSSQETTADSPTEALPLPGAPAPDAEEKAVEEKAAEEPAAASDTAPDAATSPLPVPDDVTTEVEAMVADASDEADTPEEPDEPEADGPSVREMAAEACKALIEVYEGLERRLREKDTKVLGWSGQLAALRAMRDGRIAGDAEELARLLVAAEAQDVTRDVPVGEAVQEALREGERTLVLAPTEARAEEIARAAGENVLTVLVATAAEEPPPVPEPPSAQPAEAPLREDGANRTVEFRPVTSVEVTRPQEVPQPEPAEIKDDRAPEARVLSVVARPLGEAWPNSWAEEARKLQRALMWLEQWPRDQALLESLKTARERRRQELDAELAGLAARIEEMRAAVEAAEQAVVRTAAEAERLEAAQAEVVAELEGPRAEAQRLQREADAKAEEAGRLTRTAEATLARCNALEERNAQARTELQAAQQEEETLTVDLARARDDLPGAIESAERLAAESAAADAEGHTRYYRLAAAESALSARRRKRSLGQRLHVAPPPPELKDLRAEVKALTREADEAAKRAAQAKDAAERAQTYRTQLEAFLHEGAARLTAAQEAQRQLAAELSRLAKERTAATADHQEKAQRAAEAVNLATQASTLAANARRIAQEIEGRLAVARREYETARAAHDHARAEAEAAVARVAETEALLARRRGEAEEELSVRSGEFEAATAAEARSRGNVEEICGGGPVDPDVLATRQRSAMARIERLTSQLNRAEDGFPVSGPTGEVPSDDTGDVLLRTAALVCGTPFTVGATRADAEFDTLVVAGAGAVNEADFLVGAVQARRWVLLGGGADEAPPAHPEYEGHAGADRLARSPFAAASRP